MDVRCEKCQTEYELDEARLKPGGVTVKCTTCGHMFKIRKRSPTQSGVPAVPGRTGAPSGAPPRAQTTPSASPPPRAHATPGPAAPRPGPSGGPLPAIPPPPRARGETPARAPSVTPPTPAPVRVSATPPAGQGVPERSQTGSGPQGSGPTLSASGEGERNWIIRLENGETRTCRELNTLQQWIIAGQVSRESMISRSGKTWKRLGDIAELASFFIVAEEARQSRARESGSITPPRLPAVEGRATVAGMGVVQPERETVVEAVRPPTAKPAPPAPAPAPPPRAPAPAVLAVPPLAPQPGVAPAARTMPMVAPAPAPLPLHADNARSTGAWAQDAIAPMADTGGPAGPMGGAVRSPAASSPAFGGETFGGVVRPMSDDVGFSRGGGSRDGDTFDPLEALPRRSGAGLWIALGSIVVIGAAAAVVYFMFLRAPKKAEPTDRAAVTDAGGTVVAVADGGSAPAVDGGAAAPAEDPLESARTELRGDTAPRLIAAEKALSEGGKTDAATLGMRARLLTAQAQIIEDEAALAADAKTAERIRRDEKKLVLDALALAQRAIKAAGTDAAAAVLGNVAMADVMRLQAKPGKEVARYLDAARAGKPGADDQRELDLVAAQLALRDKDARAAALVQALDAGDGAVETSGDVRARWLAARLAMTNKQPDVVRTATEAILAAQPDHAGAKLLLAKVSSVDGTDPMPPELGTGPGTGAGSGPGTGAGPGTGGNTGTGTGPGTGGGGGPSAGDGYDRLVAKADKLAEVDCGQAMQYYQKALEDRPAGVEALIGMGYCHIDAKQFSSAHSKLRTALALSPRNRDALRGVAEAYQQQGRNDLAVDAYRRYLDVYPDDERVKRQIERLTGGGAGTGTGSGPATGPDSGGGAGTGTGSAPADKPPADKPADPPPAPTPTPDPAPSDSPPTTP